MQELVLDGVVYIPLKTAAGQSGYEKNYLGQLCRAGKVDGKLVGRNWYINLDSLEKHTSREYGNRGTMSFVAKKEDVAPTVFPRISNIVSSSPSDLSRKNIDISNSSATIGHERLSTMEVRTSTPGPVMPAEQQEDTTKYVFKKHTSPTLARVSVIPVQHNGHTQPTIDLTNLLPPPPKSESLVTPRVRPISRYFKEDPLEDREMHVPVNKMPTEPLNSLQDEVTALRQERERRAHQYLVQKSVARPVTIDPIHPHSARVSPHGIHFSFDWFVPVSLAILGIIFLGGVGYVAFEQLSHREYASESLEAQRATPTQTALGFLFERKVEFK